MERALQDGASPDNIAAFRKGIQNNIRKISRNDNDETIVRPEAEWALLQSAIKSRDVKGNCDIDENGDVMSYYDVFKFIDNGTGTYSFELSTMLILLIFKLPLSR